MTSWVNTRYENVYAYIEEGIRSGDMRPGDRLEGERKLADKLGLSRETIRLGLDLAEQAGLIVRIPQRGTYVAQPRVNQNLGAMRSFEQTVQKLSMVGTYRLEKIEPTKLDKEATKKLGVAPSSNGLMVEVVGLADGLPMAFYQSILPEWVGSAIGADAPWGERASYALAGAALGLSSLDVTQEFEAVSLERKIAQKLRMRSGTAAFKVASLFYAPDGRPIEMRHAWYPGSRYHFNISRKIDL